MFSKLKSYLSWNQNQNHVNSTGGETTVSSHPYETVSLRRLEEGLLRRPNDEQPQTNRYSQALSTRNVTANRALTESRELTASEILSLYTRWKNGESYDELTKESQRKLGKPLEKYFTRQDTFTDLGKSISTQLEQQRETAWMIGGISGAIGLAAFSLASGMAGVVFCLAGIPAVRTLYKLSAYNVQEEEEEASNRFSPTESTPLLNNP